MVRAVYCALGLGTVLLLIASGAAQSCGQRKAANTLVWKGQESKDGHWPWHVALWRNLGGSITYFCGGTILDNNVILTAAHCVRTPTGLISREQVIVQVGRNRLKLADDRTKEHEVSELIVHPGYTTNKVDHDLAVVKLATDITYTDYVQPVCLWDRDSDLATLGGRRGFVVGFGIDESKRPSDTLREAQLPLVDNFQCVRSNPNLFGPVLTEKMVCGGDRNGTSACNGDSGGGLFFQFGEIWYIRGIVSYTQSRSIDGVAHKVCDPNEYTVFSDVAKYLDWIGQYLRKAGPTPPPPVDNNPKLNLLGLDTCGSNAFPNRAESSKPVFLGYPWVGLLEYTETGSREKKTVCHATLISDRYLLTAAHCVVNLPSRYKLSTVRLGEYDKTTGNDCAIVDGRTECAPPVQTLRIESVIAHKSFNTPKFANDIALVRLRDRADIGQRNVKPICLPFSKELRSFKPSVFTLTAWPAGSSATTIERSERGIVDTVECQRKYTQESLQLEKSYREICVQQQDAVGTRCKFPASAAPLQVVQNVRGSERYVLHGMLSYGPKTCSSQFPDVYVNVGSYMEWILSQMQE